MGKHNHAHIEASGVPLAQAARDALEKAGEAWTEHLSATAADRDAARSYLRTTAMLDMVESACLAG